MEPSQCASSQYIPYRPTCPRDRFQECKTLAKTRHEHVTFYRCTECVDFFFSPKEKIWFSKMGWGSAHWGTAFFHSPTLLVLILLLEGKGRGSFPKAAHFQGLLPCVLWSDTFRELQTVQRWQQEEAEAGDRAQVPRTPHAGDPGRNERTGKVERLKDNQRGLSVVIYNRDCKMVN